MSLCAEMNMETCMMKLLVAFGFMSLATSLAMAQTDAASRPPLMHCVYNNRTFSPGAIICISKSHYQQCVAGKLDKNPVNTVLARWMDAKADEAGCSASWPDNAIVRQPD
jgi:hypothetical protein